MLPWGLCCNCSGTTRNLSLDSDPSRLPSSCQSDVSKAHTWSGHPLPTPKAPLALGIEYWPLSTHSWEFPVVLSPTSFCLRPLDRPLVLLIFQIDLFLKTFGHAVLFVRDGLCNRLARIHPSRFCSNVTSPLKCYLL